MATQRLDKIMGEVPGVPPGQTMINIVKRIDRGLEVGSPDRACRSRRDSGHMTRNRVLM